MSTERKDLRIKLLELGGSISACWDKATVGKFDQARAEREVDAATDAILAAGYRRPRTVTTVEEVAALPVDSVLAGRPLRLDSTVGNIFCVADPDAEEQAGLYVLGVDGVQSFEFIFDDLPATVLHEPEAGK